MGRSLTDRYPLHRLPTRSPVHAWPGPRRARRRRGVLGGRLHDLAADRSRQMTARPRRCAAPLPDLNTWGVLALTAALGCYQVSG